MGGSFILRVSKLDGLLKVPKRGRATSAPSNVGVRSMTVGLKHCGGESLKASVWKRRLFALKFDATPFITTDWLKLAQSLETAKLALWNNKSSEHLWSSVNMWRLGFFYSIRKPKSTNPAPEIGQICQFLHV